MMPYGRCIASGFGCVLTDAIIGYTGLVVFYAIIKSSLLNFNFGLSNFSIVVLIFCIINNC